SIAPESCEQTAINIDGSFGFFKCSRQRNSQIGMFRFARAIYDASHHGNLHLFYAAISALPNRHLLAQIRLNLLGHFLEEGAGGASATWASGDLRGEAADAERLQNLLRNANLFGAVAARSWRQRNANRIADSCLPQHAQG